MFVVLSITWPCFFLDFDFIGASNILQKSLARWFLIDFSLLGAPTWVQKWLVGTREMDYALISSAELLSRCLFGAPTGSTDPSKTLFCKPNYTQRFLEDFISKLKISSFPPHSFHQYAYTSDPFRRAPKYKCLVQTRKPQQYVACLKHVSHLLKRPTHTTGQWDVQESELKTQLKGISK